MKIAPHVFHSLGMSCKTEWNTSKTVDYIEDILGTFFPDIRYMSIFMTGKFDEWKTEMLTDVTYVNGSVLAVYTSSINQNFRLFRSPNWSVLYFSFISSCERFTGNYAIHIVSVPPSLGSLLAGWSCLPQIIVLGHNEKPLKMWGKFHTYKWTHANHLQSLKKNNNRQ